jgi:hypothetical protein
MLRGTKEMSRLPNRHPGVSKRRAPASGPGAMALPCLSRLCENPSCSMRYSRSAAYGLEARRGCSKSQCIYLAVPQRGVQ